MENLPVYIPIVFALATFLAVYFFYKAAHHSKTGLIILLVWMALQACISLTGFYTHTKTNPPRFILLAGPAVLFIIFLFATKTGRIFIDSLSLQFLTLLHVVRIPVELVLFALYLHNAVPRLMTFEGRNFDMLSGISALFIYYFGFVKKQAGRNVLLVWNIICLGLLLNVVINAVLSVPTSFQQFAFDQPNIAVLYFPFTWLPAVVVPLVLFSHLAAIRKLVKRT
ncbi:MAG: hypothetical protein ABIW38_08580 [Ferruginibacter sp.]